MLAQKTKDALAALKINVDKLVAAVKDEKETEVELPEVQVFTKEELEKRDSATEGNGYKKGKTAGEEMLLDEMKKAEGLEYEGKTKENFLSAIKTKYEGEKAKDVDQKIKDRDTKIKNLQDQISKKESEFEKVNKEFSSFKSDYEFMQALPEERNPALTNQEWVYRLRNNGISIEEAEGKKVVRVNGEIVLDSKTQQPLPVGDAISGIFKSKEGWLKPSQNGRTEGGKPAGKGGKDVNAGGGAGIFKTKSEFDAAMTEQGISFTNEKYQAALNDAVKANPEMDMAK